MDFSKTIEKQFELGQAMCNIYNDLHKIVKKALWGELVIEQVNAMCESFTDYQAKFEENDGKLQSPSHVLSKNRYYTSKFVSDVRDVIEKFAILKKEIDGKLEESKRVSTLTLNEFPSTSKKLVENKNMIGEENRSSSERQTGKDSSYLIGHFQYALDDLEYNINEANEKKISREEIRDRFNTAERFYFEYSKEFRVSSSI